MRSGSPDRHAGKREYASELARFARAQIWPGSLELLPDVTAGRVPCFVTDAHLAGLAMIDGVRSRLPDAPMLTVPAGEPTVGEVDSLATRLAEFDTVIAVGGGSVLDSAKLAAAVAASGTTVELHLLGATPVTATLPVIAVPTTAGSGAEVTRTCVVTDRGRKSWAWDELLRPGRVVLDPELTVGLPRAATAATGLDALVHAVEAVTARRVDPVATRLGLEAARVIAATLPTVLADLSDLDARTDMLTASTAAGVAIDRCGTGIAHGLGHALGSLVPIAHGFAVAFSLSVASELNESSQDDRCDTVAGALGGGGYAGGLAAIFEAAGLEERVRPVALAHPLDRSRLTAETLSEANAPMCANNVRPVGTEEVSDLARLLAARWERIGGRP